MAEADDRPRWARIVHVGVAAELFSLVAWTSWQWVVDDRSVWALWPPLLCGAALVGLLRRVAWGRFLFSVVSLLLALSALVIFMPDPDDSFAGGRPMIHWLGHLPLALWWVIVVASGALPLLPAIAIGWRRRWFRDARW